MDITKKASVGGYIGQKEYRQNRVNTGAFEAKQTRIAEIVGHRDTINLKARELKNPLDASDDVESFIQRQAHAKEQAYRSKLNRAERERLIAAIKVRQSILGIGDIQQMGINREEQINAAQQTRHEAKVITQNISTEMTGSPLMARVARILGKLPEKAYKYLSATVILSMALSACSAINHSKEFEAGQAESPAATAAVPDSVSDDEAVIEVTPSIAPTETAQPMDPVEDLLSRYLAGEDIDVSTLTQEEFIEFSAKLAEEKNEARGINPIIYDDGTGNPAYINPDNYMLMNYDGHPDMNETIQMFVPIAGKDDQGNLQFEVDGQIVTIPGSADEDWNMVISDANDTRIDWPETKILSSGMTDAEQKVTLFDVVLSPMILLDKKLGQFYLAGQVPLMQSTLRFLKIETDQTGHPLFARKIITHGTFYYLSTEGSDLDIRSPLGPIPTDSKFYKALVTNSIYYIGLSPSVEKSYATMENSVDGYSGAVVDDTAFKIIFDQAENDKDMVIIPATTLMMKN